MSLRAVLLVSVACASPLLAQNAPAPGPVTFDVVSVKRHPPEQGIAALNSNQTQRPDGSLTLSNMPAGLFISRAYGIAPANMAGLPDWAMRERYDLSATASLAGVATAGQRAAMMKAMLADRFNLSAHVEAREQAAYDLILTRADGTLGPGLTRTASDCDKVVAERTAAQAATPQTGRPAMPDFKTPPECSFRVLEASMRERLGDGQSAQGGLLEGEGTMAMLAGALRLGAGRLVVDKTGLTGSYRVTLNFDAAFARRPPDVQPPENAGPSVFVALPNQLGLKLEASKTRVDTLVIDHLERPPEN